MQRTTPTLASRMPSFGERMPMGKVPGLAVAGTCTEK